MRNKKVLLRERKRHTARRVVSTPSVVLPGYPPQGGGGTRSGTPPPGGVRYPPLGGVPGQVPGGYPVRYPPPGVRYPPWGGYLGGVQSGTRGGTQSGTPQGGYPVRSPPGGYPVRYPPPPPLPHGILGNVAKHYGIWVPPPLWTDRWMDGRTDACQNITFPSYYVRGR